MKYRVWAKMTSYSYVDVEADSESEAMSMAEEIDGGEFIGDDDPLSGDWEICRADEREEQ